MQQYNPLGDQKGRERAYFAVTPIYGFPGFKRAHTCVRVGRHFLLAAAKALHQFIQKFLRTAPENINIRTSAKIIFQISPCTLGSRIKPSSGSTCAAICAYWLRRLLPGEASMLRYSTRKSQDSVWKPRNNRLESLNARRTCSGIISLLLVAPIKKSK